jgi:hypothetical protein
MKALFQAKDAKRFEKFDCKTCHGKDAKERHFEMPSPELPALDPSDGFAADKKAHPDMLSWMGTTVVPAMVEALHVAPFDPATHQGFGCFACHTKKK